MEAKAGRDRGAPELPSLSTPFSHDLRTLPDVNLAASSPPPTDNHTTLTLIEAGLAEPGLPVAETRRSIMKTVFPEV